MLMKKKEMKQKRTYEQARMEPVLLSSRASLLAESGVSQSANTPNAARQDYQTVANVFTFE